MTPFFQIDLSSLGLATSRAQMLQTWLSAMQTAYPGYSPSASSLEYVQAQVFASQAADLAQLCAAGSTELFRTFGTKLMNLPYQNGSSASAVATVTAVDTAGYTLPAGSQLTLTLGGVPLGFQTATVLTIAPGATSGTVTVVAVQTGTTFNGATNPAQLVSQVNWVTGVSVASSASGGVDQESDDAYIQRLGDTLQLLAPRPITASDFATLAINYTPAPGTDQQEIGRAAAIDGYDPGTNTYNNQREVTVCVADANGVAVNSDTMTALQTYLVGLREANFIVNVVQPAYTPVYVACQIHATSGFLAATVQANVQTALLAYLSPPNFGLPRGANVGWTNSQTVFRSVVEAVIQNTSGVDHIVAGTLAIDVSSPPSNTTNDLLLAGAFPLPTSTTATVPLSALQVV